MVEKFLLVESDFVYPPNHGGRVDGWNRIKTIHEMGGYIHLVCTVKKDSPKEYTDIVKKYVDKLTLVYRKNRIIDMLHERPLQMVSRKKLEYIDLDETHNYLIMNGSYVVDIIKNTTLNVTHKILRMNNDDQCYS